MADPKGFLKIKREHPVYRLVQERVQDYKSVFNLRSDTRSIQQASRCMDCGTPFCHSGCPLGNYIPEYNDAVFHGHWEQALKLLNFTNNLPEITGRVCPALCEYACVLGINDDPVTIRDNELAVIEHAFKHNMIIPAPSRRRSGKKVAVVGSGPAGIACADQLNKAGHSVVVFEKDEAVGGILRFGIPDFKLEKKILDRRINILQAEGIEFRTGTCVGEDLPVKKLMDDFDAICLAGGCRVPRDLNVPGRDLKGIHFAMDYLMQSNRRTSGSSVKGQEDINACGKHVLVIGGGDTGADCVGTAHRQKAASVTQIEVLAQPPQCRTENMPWPKYPMLLKNSTSHEEGGRREWAVLTKEFLGQNGAVRQASCVRVDFSQTDPKGCPVMKEVTNSTFCIPAQLVVLAVGFVHPQHKGLLAELGVKFDQRKNVATDISYKTSVEKVFAAGDMRRGQSLVVWAIAEGRRCAYYMDMFLMGESILPIM